jgi:hypothetical protein
VSRAPEFTVHRWIRYALEEHLNFLPRRPIVCILPASGWVATYLADLSLCSLFVPLLLLPAILFYSNLWSWSQVFSNILLVPLFGAAVPLCLLLFVTFWLPGSSILAWTIGWYGDFLLSLIDWSSARVWVDYVAQPSRVQTAVYLIAFPAAFLLLRGRWKLLAVAPSAVLFVLLNLRMESHPAGRLTITFLDVGQSESIHIRYP